MIPTAVAIFPRRRQTAPVQNKNTMSYVWFALFGGFFAASIVSWVAPGAIAWYFKPPAQVEFSCEAPIRWALEKLRLTQFVGLGVGLLGGFFIRFAFRKRKDQPAYPTEIRHN